MEEVTLPAPPEGYGYKLVPLKPGRTDKQAGERLEVP